MKKQKQLQLKWKKKHSHWVQLVELHYAKRDDIMQSIQIDIPHMQKVTIV